MRVWGCVAQVPKLVDRYMAGETKLDQYITHELPFDQVSAFLHSSLCVHLQAISGEGGVLHHDLPHGSLMSYNVSRADQCRLRATGCRNMSRDRLVSFMSPTHGFLYRSVLLQGNRLSE